MRKEGRLLQEFKNAYKIKLQVHLNDKTDSCCLVVKCFKHVFLFTNTYCGQNIKDNKFLPVIIQKSKVFKCCHMQDTSFFLVIFIMRRV